MIILLFFIFLFGLAIGSFLNCLIWRLHTGEGMWNRSYCPKCKHQIAWYDNIPIISFIILGGKCRHCGQRISWQYPLVELITGILFVVAFMINLPTPAFGHPSAGGDLFNFDFFTSLPSEALAKEGYFLLLTLRSWFLISVMIIIFIYDLRWYLILDVVTLPACAIIIILNLFLGVSWQNMAISGIIGSSFFLFQLLISQGKWIGGGDVRLGLLMGFSLGWPNIITGIMIAYLIGAIVGIILIISRYKKWNSKVPLGVFLSTSTIMALFWGEKIIKWYINFFLT